MQDNKTELQFVTYENVGDHIEYKISVKDPQNQSYELQARYRTLRDIFNQLKDNLGQEGLPEFPPKRLFGNMNVDFITSRKAGLESFFNKLLQKFSLDELQPLKNFLKAKRQSTTREEPEQQKTIQPKPVPVVIPNNQPVNPVVQPKPEGRPPVSVVDQYKNLFFSLNDNFAPPDVDDPEVKRKKNRYESNIKIDLDMGNPIYKLPSGNESNLISIHDETIPSLNGKLVEELTESLDEIRKKVNAINFPNIQKIIVHLE
jgi:hypothetical protein